MHPTILRCSSVTKTKDQAHQKEYNKKAKDEGGIIGMTRRQESIAKWNVIEYERDAFTNFVDNNVG